MFDEAIKSVQSLRQRFDSFQGENSDKCNFYDGKYRMQDLGISLPPGMPIDTVVGWPSTVVDVLEERLDFEGWTDDRLDALYVANDLDVKAPMVHIDGLLYGTSFVTVTAGLEGEPAAVISAASPREMVGIRNHRTGLCDIACRFIWNDDGILTGAILFEKDRTTWLSAQGSMWQVDRVDDHNLGRVPVVMMVNRPRLARAGGRSEITPAIKGYTQAALRTLVGAEVAREFYAVPQRYMMGAPESFFVDEDGNPRGAWDAMMGKILAVERDPDTGEIPTVGSFPANSTEPFFSQLRSLALQVASESSMPADYFGVVTDNPSSADAIRMAENRLVKRAERRQAWFGKGWTEVARLALMVSEGRGFESLTTNELSIRPEWRDPATPTRAAAADEIQKMVAAGIYEPQGEYTMKRLGLSPQDREMLKRDRASSARNALMESIRARQGQGESLSDSLAAQTTDPNQEGQDTSSKGNSGIDYDALKKQADAMGALVRAGVKAESALRLAGLESAEFWDGRPITLRYDDEE